MAYEPEDKYIGVSHWGYFKAPVDDAPPARYAHNPQFVLGLQYVSLMHKLDCEA